MDNLYVYILKVNIALLVFWLFCRLVFGKDTFLGIKRACLLTVLGLSFVYPLIDIASWIKEEQQVVLVRYAMDIQHIAFSVLPQEQAVVLTWERILWGIYLAGALFLCVRMLVQLWYIWRFIRLGKRLDCLGTTVVSPGSRNCSFFLFAIGFLCIRTIIRFGKCRKFWLMKKHMSPKNIPWICC